MSLCAVPYDVVFNHFSQKEKNRAKKSRRKFLSYVGMVEDCGLHKTKFECNNYIRQSARMFLSVTKRSEKSVPEQTMQALSPSRERRCIGVLMVIKTVFISTLPSSSSITLVVISLHRNLVFSYYNQRTQHITDTHATLNRRPTASSETQGHLFGEGEKIRQTLKSRKTGTLPYL